MAKYTNIEVVKNLYISESGIQFNSKNSTLTDIPGIRFNELSSYWEYNNGNEQWLPIGAGKTDVFYVDQFPTKLPIEIGIYITEEGESKYYTGENWISLSLEAVTNLTQHTTDNKVIPTCKAVADYVMDTIEDYTKDFITSSVSELENFYNKTDIDNKNYITSSVINLTNFYNKTEIDELIPEIKQHIFTVDNIPEEIIPNSIYVLTNTKQTYISDNNGILSSISYEIISDLSQHTTDIDTIPACKAVVDFVNNKCNNYILTGTIFNYNTDLSGKPDLSIYLPSSTFANVSGNFATKSDLLNKIEFNINDSIPTTNLSANTLYITPSGEVAALINDTLTNLSIQLVTDMSQFTTSDNTGPTCKAVANYVSGVIEDLPISDVQHIFYVNELPIKSNRVENSIYTISSTNQSFIIDNNKNEYPLSYEIVETINSSSTNDTIPGTKAVYDYVNSHSGGSSSKTYLEIQYGVDQQDCIWNNNTLIIEHGLDTQLPFVQIYITENNSYTLTNIPYVIDKTSHNIIINCAGYENKLISVKIID